MREVALANARYWLSILLTASQGRQIPNDELRGAAKAIAAVLRFPDLWDVTKLLAQALHPHMEQRGLWIDWDDCLQVLANRAQQQGDHQAEAEIVLQRAGIQRQRGDYKGATKSCYRAWQLYRHMQERTGLAHVFSQLGDLYRLREKFWRAELLCLTAIRLYDKGEHLNELAQAENRWGLVFFDLFRYSEALQHFLISETLWRQTNNLHGLAKVLHNLGALYRRTRDLEKALVYLENAVQNYLVAGDEIYAARTQLDIGNVYLNQKKWSQAEVIYLQVETILRRANDSLDLAGTRLNLGIVYTHMKNWSEADACFTRALEQWRSRGDLWREANTLSEMGRLYIECGDHARAKNYLDEAWELIDGRTGAQFELLKQELIERQQKLAF